MVFNAKFVKPRKSFILKIKIILFKKKHQKKNLSRQNYSKWDDRFFKKL
jgi:hypothetical protein